MRKAIVAVVSLAVLALAGTGSAQTECVIPPNGLVSWWPGDGNALDISGGNNGALQNGATFAAGNVKQAFSLDGTDDFVLVPDSPTLDIPGSLTVDAWFHLDTLKYTNTIISKERPELPFYVNYNLHVYNSRLFFAVTFDAPASKTSGTGGCDTGGCYVTGGTVVGTSSFHHVAGVYDDSTKTLSVYLDGSPDGQATFSTTGKPTTNDQDIRIGKRNAYTTTEFDGLIDEVEIFNRALTATEIETIFNAGVDGKCKVQVQIDIKPGSDPNSINCCSKGVIPVAILTDANFDATTIDPTSISFGGRKIVGKKGQALCHVEDVDGDWDFDLICQIPTLEYATECGNSTEALLEAVAGGQKVYGKDSVNIVKTCE